MTNREWLNSLSNEELMRWLIYGDYDKIAFSFTSTYIGMVEWLGKQKDTL